MSLVHGFRLPTSGINRERLPGIAFESIELIVYLGFRVYSRFL